MASSERRPQDEAREPEAPVLVREIKLQNFLSFGAKGSSFALRPLNLVIGPNGAGKSNFVEAFALLQATRGDLDRLIRRGGGVQEWLGKSVGRPTSDVTESVEVTLSRSLVTRRPIHYSLAFGAAGVRFQVLDERIFERFKGNPRYRWSGYYYAYDGGAPMLRGADESRRVRQIGSVDPTRSILAQRRDPEQYPELTDIGDRFEGIQLYREWISGRSSPVRNPQRADMPNDHLLEDGTNLGMVLNRIQADHPAAWASIREALGDLLDGFEDLIIKAEAGAVQMFLVEGAGRRVPAMRMSDGTLRFLYLLAILCDPSPPPLVVIEEPELGLHPDAVSILPRLLRAASERMQLVVTTHSESLVDAFTESPEDVVVVERDAAGTNLRRLDQSALSEWLQKYRLGQLWVDPTRSPRTH